VFSVRLAKGPTPSASILENPTEHMRAVDVEAFRNLVDPDEEEFLRTNLPPAWNTFPARHRTLPF
jgi:hypothetical protein